MQDLKVSAGPIVDRFRRITTSGGYVPEIDGLRFIAIAAVVAVHVWGYWVYRADRGYADQSLFDRGIISFVSLGYYGVHLFFMISGFVLAVPFCKQAFDEGPSVDLRKYFWRRLTRLEPPYIISMLVFFATMPFFGKGSWAELWPHLLASLGYVHNIVYGEGSLINNNAWSLEIEVQFYLLVPVIAALLWLPTLPRRLSLASAAVVLSANALWLSAHAPKSILQFGQYFLVGFILCDIWTISWRNRARGQLADLPGIAAWPLFAYVNLQYPGLAADLSNPWLIAMLFYSSLCGVWHSRLLSYGAIPIIGGMCYSIYLLHARVIAAVIHGGLARLPLTGTFAFDYPVVLAICSVAVLLVSGIFFLLIEKPCMDPRWPSKTIVWIRGAVVSGAFSQDKAAR
jgi:peptidoglycan/LPS O-acetylase OafA/YrhL